MTKHAVALAVALGALFGSVAQAAVVTIDPSSLSKLTNDTFSVDVKISGLGTEIVSVFDLNIYFDPTVLNGIGYKLCSGLGWPWVDLSTNPIPSDNFDLFAYSNLVDPADPTTDDQLAALQTPGGVTLVTLDFEAINPGVSQVSFGFGANERDIVGRNAQFLSVQYQGACVAVNSPTGGSNDCNNSVPEPASYGLVGLALAGAMLPGLRRRRQQAAAA